MVAGLDGTLSVFVGAIALGVVHGAEPGHGWPVAAAYALDHERRWFHGFAASFLLGLGHLVSSIAVVVVFFLAKDYFGLTQLGWIRYVAGVLLIALGIREYRHGHSHDHGDDHSHDHGDGHGNGGDHSHDHGDHQYHDHGHSHDDGHTHHTDRDHSHDGPGLTVASHDHGHDLEYIHSIDDPGHEHGEDDTDSGPDSGPPSAWERFVAALPVVGDGSGGHTHLSADDVDRQGLTGIVGTAFVLGFAHEEEFEIIGLCLGSSYCLELMLVYALAVLVALVALTLALLAGFERYGERVEQYADHLPTVSAVVLVALGVGFIFGVV